MSPFLASGTADHGRARELAAARLDEAVPAAEAGWLEDHLAACPDCSAVAAEYDDQRSALRSLRLDTPEPPRDLWARTSAALESEGARGSWRPAWLRVRTVPLAPVAALMVVTIVVGAGLLNGRGLFPDSTSKGEGPMPTPINVAATDVQVVSRGDDGTVQILTRRLDQVCPMGAEACGISPSFDVTTTAALSGSSDLDAINSPSRDQMVVVERGAGATGVYVLNVGTASPAPSASVAVPPATTGPTGAPTASPGAATPRPSATTAPPTPDPSASGAPAPSASAAPSTPDPSASVAPSPSPSVAPSPSAITTTGPSPTPGLVATGAPVTPDASATATPGASAAPPASTKPSAPAPTATVAVSPDSNGALEIARDVIVVGSLAAYSPDGSRFAFTARPADGSVGPDVYVWTVGDAGARAVTTDHASVFSGWLGERLLVSRVVDGKPETALMNLGGGTETAVGTGSTWRPAVSPNHKAAVWWDGTLKLADDGVTPVPGAGRLVLGSWPAGKVAAESQVLHTGALSDWEVHWDQDGTVLAVWTTTKGAGAAGSLSLYSIDPATGRADLDHPLLDAAPAFASVSLEAGRLVWSAPADGGDTTVQVLAWSGDSVGRLELPSQQGTTVVH